MITAPIKTDAQIQTDVLNELRWDRTVDATEVGVQVHNGIVTLTGAVNAYPKKFAARDAAHRVWGVLDVVDDMTVRIPSASERSDEAIAKALRHALEWDILVPDARIRTTVSNGIITLEGHVDTWTQREDAERCAQRLTGVKGVSNQITVVGPEVDAAKIKRAIEDALERQSEREAKRIGVSVREGVVTLSGHLRSWGEKNAIERVATFAPGVRRVDDNTTVDPYR